MNRPEEKRSFVSALWGPSCGFASGLALAFFSFRACGAGHGTYLPLALASAPMSLVGNIRLAFLATPLLWAGLGLALGKSNRRPYSIIFPVALILHYVAVAILLFAHDSSLGFADGLNSRYFRLTWKRAPEALLAWLGVYMASQVFFWIAYSKKRRSTGS